MKGKKTKGETRMPTDKQNADRQLSAAYEQYGKRLTNYCYARLKENKNAADDCVQNAFLVFYRRLLTGEVFDNPKAFLYRTADNMCKKADEEAIRKTSKTVTLDNIADIPAPENDPHATERDYDEIRDILLQKLSEDEQRLYNMKYVENMPLTEIAEILRIKPSAAAKRTSRLRAKIHSLIEPVLEEYTKGG